MKDKEKKDKKKKKNGNGSSRLNGVGRRDIMKMWCRRARCRRDDGHAACAGGLGARRRALRPGHG